MTDQLDAFGQSVESHRGDGCSMDPVRVVDNRRTMCDHCSLRRDLPGFVSREHAQANADEITAGRIFQCHMIRDPHIEAPPHRACLGAALVAEVPLLNTPAGLQPPVYEDLAEYVKTQTKGRVSKAWLMANADYWHDRNADTWYGWWAPAPAGNWRYLMTTDAQNEQESAYLFFDQAQELFGPLDRS
jgi:hypothetical protein